MIPKLNWNRKNIGKLILYNELKVIRRSKAPKNNQFNVKWYFNRFLFSYYQPNYLPLSFIENRLDIILFRTNWFISYNQAKDALLRGKVSVNKKLIKNSALGCIKKGDVIKVDGLVWKKKEIKYAKNFNYMDWFKNRYNFILKNPPYLEVNFHIKTIIILKNPQYKNIPYPKNLEVRPT